MDLDDLAHPAGDDHAACRPAAAEQVEDRRSFALVADDLAFLEVARRAGERAELVQPAPAHRGDSVEPRGRPIVAHRPPLRPTLSGMGCRPVAVASSTLRFRVDIGRPFHRRIAPI